MALARSFKERVQKRVASDPAFGEALLREGIDTMLAGDVDAGKAILRDYIKATVGFGNRQAQMIFAKAAAPALPSSFGRRLGFSATTADTAATALRPLPKIASILFTQSETSSLARR